MDCNKVTSWDDNSDASDNEQKEEDQQMILEAKKELFLRKYTSFPLKVKKIFLILYIQREELIQIFVQSDFNEEKINLILGSKLIEIEKNKKFEQTEKKEEKINNININQSNNNSWKDKNAESNFNNKKNYPKYKKNNHYFHNKSNNFYGKKNNFYGKKNNYNKHTRHHNHTHNLVEVTSFNTKTIEKEIDLNSKSSKEESEADSEKNTNSNIIDSNYLKSAQFALDNTDLSLNLMKSQSAELSNKEEDINLRDVGFKLFPGAFHQNKISEELENKNKNFPEYYGNNFCRKYTDDSYQKSETKKKCGLALAYDYYCSSFHDNKIMV